MARRETRFPDQKYLFPASHRGPFLARLITIDGLYKDVMVERPREYFETTSSLSNPYYEYVEGQAPGMATYYRRAYKAERFNFQKRIPISELHMGQEELFRFVSRIKEEHPFADVGIEHPVTRGDEIIVRANAVEYREIPPQPERNIYIYDGVWQALKRAAKGIFNRVKFKWNIYKINTYTRNDYR